MSPNSRQMGGWRSEGRGAAHLLQSVPGAHAHDLVTSIQDAGSARRDVLFRPGRSLRPRRRCAAFVAATQPIMDPGSIGGIGAVGRVRQHGLSLPRRNRTETGQGPAVARAVPVGAGAGLPVVGAGAWAVGAPVGKGVGETVCEGVGETVGQEVGAGMKEPVWVVVGVPAGVLSVVCGARDLCAGVLLLTGVDVAGVLAAVGGGRSMK